MPASNGRASRRRLTGTELLTAILQDAGGSLDRGETMRRLAVIVGIRETRSAVGLGIAIRDVTLDDDDVLHLQVRP